MVSKRRRGKTIAEIEGEGGREEKPEGQDWRAWAGVVTEPDLPDAVGALVERFGTHRVKHSIPEEITRGGPLPDSKQARVESILLGLIQAGGGNAARKDLIARCATEGITLNHVNAGTKRLLQRGTVVKTNPPHNAKEILYEVVKPVPQIFRNFSGMIGTTGRVPVLRDCRTS